MPNTREKLIELLETVVSQKELLCFGEVLVSTSRVADHLISHGVTFATNNKWIPVTERLPETFGEYLVAVKEETNNMYTDYADYDPYVKSWKTGLFLGLRDKVTHWMPLPEPPKED